MPDWSPAAPDTLGLGWFPGSNGTKTLSTGFQSIGWRFEADVTETVVSILTPVRSVTTAGQWILEVYESGDEVSGAVSTQTFRPNGDAEITNWYDQADGQTNIYQYIDEATIDFADYVYYGATNKDDPTLTFQFATTAWAAARRVTAVRIGMVCGCQEGSVAFTGAASIGGSVYTFGGSAGVGTETATVEFEVGEINPATVLPWTRADIQAFDAGDALGITGTPGMENANGFRIYQMWVDVDYVTETRMVVGVEELATATPDGWATWNTLVDPNVNANTDWDKVNGTSYVVTLRNLGNASELYNGTAGYPWLSSDEPLPTGWEQSYLPVDATGLITVPFTDYETDRSAGLLFTISGPAYSTDGQPWTTLDGYQNVTTRQQITGVVGTYGRLRFAWADTSGIESVDPPTGDLTVAVKRQSDNVQVGSTETFTIAQLQAGTLIGTAHIDPQGVNVEAPLYLIERDFTSDPTLAAVQYYVEFVGTGHVVPVAQPGFAQDYGGNATYHGTTDRGTIGSAVNSADYPVTLSTIPSAPTGFDVTAADADLLTATDTACGIDSFDYAALVWTATALGLSFGYYEIQRDNGDALGFQTIALITDETVDAARDYESTRGSVDYRMRVVRSTDGIASDWTATETVVLDRAGDALWLFTSNAYPDLTCAYNVTDQQTYNWPDAPRQRVINHYGTDDKTRYVETERRLTEFPLPLTVYSQGLTSDGTLNRGVAPFFPLLELCSQTSAPGVAKTVTAYVAVIDPNGNSWYAAVTVEAGTVLVSQSNAHTCTPNIVQLTETPCPFDVDGGS